MTDASACLHTKKLKQKQLLVNCRSAKASIVSF